MCLNVHQQSFLRRQFSSLVLLASVFLIEAADTHPSGTLINADTLVWHNLLNIGTCDHIWDVSKIQSAIVLLPVRFILVLIVGLGQQLAVMGRSPTVP